MPPITMVGTPSVWLVTVKTCAARPASVARLGDSTLAAFSRAFAPGDVGCAPGQAPEMVGPVGYALLQIVRDLDHEIAAAEEQEARAPVGLLRSSRRSRPSRPA